MSVHFSANLNTVITKEIPDTIKLKLTSDRIAKETKEIVDSLFKTLKDIDAESHKYACLTRELHALGLMLETERLSFKGIMKLAERVEVKNLLARLKADLADELEQDEQSID
jgi:SRSO17 transposase